MGHAVPPEGDRRFAAVIFWVPLLAAIPFALATSTGINGLWTMSGLSLFGVVLLSSPLVRLCGSSTAFIAMAAMATGACALLASPVVAAWEHFYGVENHAAYNPANLPSRFPGSGARRRRSRCPTSPAMP